MPTPPCGNKDHVKSVAVLMAMCSAPSYSVGYQTVHTHIPHPVNAVPHVSPVTTTGGPMKMEVSLTLMPAPDVLVAMVMYSAVKRPVQSSAAPTQSLLQENVVQYVPVTVSMTCKHTDTWSPSWPATTPVSTAPVPTPSYAVSPSCAPTETSPVGTPSGRGRDAVNLSVPAV